MRLVYGICCVDLADTIIQQGLCMVLRKQWPNKDIAEKPLGWHLCQDPYIKPIERECKMHTK